MTEDRDFYRHAGVSIRRSLGAVRFQRQERARLQGGSTLTQQLVKNLYLSPGDGRWRRKADRGGPGRDPRRAVFQGRDLRGVLERDLPRPVRLGRGQRGRGGGAPLLRQGGERPRPGRVGDDRRDDQGAQRLFAAPQRRPGEAEAGPRPAADARGEEDRRRRSGEGAGAQPVVCSSRARSRAPTPRTSWTSSRASSRRASASR